MALKVDLEGGKVANSRMQIPDSRIYSPSICDEGGKERASSHKYTTTLWHCGLEWVAALLKKRLRARDEEEASFEECPIDKLYDTPFSNKFVEVLGLNGPHIFGHGGCVIRRIEAVCGFF